MPDHKFELLNAYLDGELNLQQRRKFEAHLDTCPKCQAELESLESLSGMLAEAPLPEFPAPEQFAANVSLQLPRSPQREAAARTRFNERWWLAPASLLLAWLALNAISLGSDLLGFASNFGLIGNVFLFNDAPANTSALLGRLGLFDPNALQWLSASESFMRHFIINTIWQVALAMLYLSFIAIWWARHNRPELNRQFG